LLFVAAGLASPVAPAGLAEPVLPPVGFVSAFGAAVGFDFAPVGLVPVLDLLDAGALAAGALLAGDPVFEVGAAFGFGAVAPSSGTSIICPLVVTGGLPFAGVAAGVGSPLGRAIDAG
jgi:hypothetical protein